MATSLSYLRLEVNLRLINIIYGLALVALIIILYLILFSIKTFVLDAETSSNALLFILAVLFYLTAIPAAILFLLEDKKSRNRDVRLVRLNIKRKFKLDNTKKTAKDFNY